MAARKKALKTLVKTSVEKKKFPVCADCGWKGFVRPDKDSVQRCLICARHAALARKRVEPQPLSADELAALEIQKQAHEIMNQINLVLSTVEFVPGYFRLFQRASRAYGNHNVEALEAVYADLCEATDTTADGMVWDPWSNKSGNFRVYCNFMKRYAVWAAKQPSRPTVVKSTPKTEETTV
jgi:hypothetical protein